METGIITSEGGPSKSEMPSVKADNKTDQQMAHAHEHPRSGDEAAYTS